MREERKERKAYKNGAEQAFAVCAESLGWKVTKRGWPDFMCFKDGSIMCVEVKAHRGRRLKKDQYATMKALAKKGVACYRWTPDGRFDKLYLDEPDKQ